MNSRLHHAPVSSEYNQKLFQLNKFIYNSISNVKINLFKYIIRFTFLQIVITYLTIWFFDNFIIFSAEDKFQLYLNLIEDRNRFIPFIPLNLISVDTVLSLICFLFLVILYSTKFYTYVNELDFAYERNYIDEFLSIYLLWNSFLFSSFFIFRFSGLSRGNLLLFTFIIPITLLLFRNGEILSGILGRPIISENFICFNLNEESIFRNLRIMSFRKNVGNFEIKSSNKIIEKIDKINKKTNINLVVINLKAQNDIPKKLEEYLINLNKKVLLMSDNSIKFKNNFLFRKEIIDKKNFVYFNNDIQYGSKYILKRLIDLIIGITLLLTLMPIFIGIYLFIRLSNGTPVFIKQKRVGLHGKLFIMYKFRTMQHNSHSLRKDLEGLNKKTGPLFKIENDPRIIKGGNFLRKFSLDEIPQLINVLLGNMSLVGPRPLFDTDTKLFNKNYMRRLNVMPGMTGLLQINDRNADDFDTWFKYDSEYIENWSLYLDLKILIKTLPSLFNKKVQGL